MSNYKALLTNVDTFIFRKKGGGLCGYKSRAKKNNSYR